MSTVSLRPAHEPWSLASLDRVVSLADCVWNADRKVLFINPDILIPEPGDLDNISKWLEFLAEEHGIVFSTNGARIRQLMVDQRSRHLDTIAYFEPDLLVASRGL